MAKVETIQSHGASESETGGNINQTRSPAAVSAGDTRLGVKLRPFAPRRNYDAIPSEPKRRHAQAADIINYVLDNSNGIFPGDKPLYFTLLRIFMDTFVGEAPLTWTHYLKVIRQMNVDKEVTTHVHLLRSEGGRMVTYTVVVHPGELQRQRCNRN